MVSTLVLQGYSLPLFKTKTKISAHLWVYASKFPPDWNSNPVLEQVFSDLAYAGYDGVELMDANLRVDSIVPEIQGFIKKYNLPVTGTSYGGAFWDKEKHDTILTDVEKVLSNLQKVGGTTFGISVGDARRIKTEAELDAQAELLKKVIVRCDHYGIVPNLHNHTYEVENELHDLKGTLARVPEIKLGLDLNWLIRGGVDPVWFIDTYGKNIIYLHIRDHDEKGVWTEAVGSGSTDFKEIAKALRRSKFSGSAAIELAFPNNFEPTMSLRENWKLSREYVRKTFK
jgi:sugar phosphate isomerase/epimerase